MKFSQFLILFTITKLKYKNQLLQKCYPKIGGEIKQKERKKSKLIHGTTVYTCQYFLNMDYCKKKK